MKTFIIL